MEPRSSLGATIFPVGTVAPCRSYPSSDKGVATYLWHTFSSPQKPLQEPLSPRPPPVCGGRGGWAFSIFSSLWDPSGPIKFGGLGLQAVISDAPPYTNSPSEGLQYGVILIPIKERDSFSGRNIPRQNFGELPGEAPGCCPALRLPLCLRCHPWRWQRGHLGGYQVPIGMF